MYKMKAFRIFLQDGTDYVTDISGNSSDEAVEEYFVGHLFTHMRGRKEVQLRCIKIERIA